MIKIRKRVVEESWDDLQVRLHGLRADFQRMLDQINSKRRPPRFWKWERHLKSWLKPKIEWIDKILAARRPVPPVGKDAALFVMVLYELDLARAKVVDDFQELMEAAGELYFTG
jgi:hypothetical protein